MQLQSLHRYERKMLVENIDRHWLRSLVFSHPAAFHECYPTRTINNIYLDTLKLDNFWDSINGANLRFKTRIRWYGKIEGKVEAILQRKYRNNSTSQKNEIKLEPLEIIDGDLWNKWFKNVCSNNSQIAQILDFTEFPTLINQYQRDYFLSACGRYRLTIDFNTKYLSQRHSDRINLTRYLPIPPYIILEIKYSRFDDVEVHRISEWFPFRVTKSSKYNTGIANYTPM
jgi:hypothetical protein